MVGKGAALADGTEGGGASGLLQVGLVVTAIAEGPPMPAAGQAAIMQTRWADHMSLG